MKYCEHDHAIIKNNEVIIKCNQKALIQCTSCGKPICKAHNGYKC
jgi:hypothetical protein